MSEQWACDYAMRQAHLANALPSGEAVARCDVTISLLPQPAPDVIGRLLANIRICPDCLQIALEEQLAGPVVRPQAHPMPNAPQDLLNELAKKSESEIIALFERYGFQDALGHPLIHCLDFLALVVLATQQRTQA
jgi:hypothetical protein